MLPVLLHGCDALQCSQQACSTGKVTWKLTNKVYHNVTLCNEMNKVVLEYWINPQTKHPDMLSTCSLHIIDNGKLKCGPFGNIKLNTGCRQQCWLQGWSWKLNLLIGCRAESSGSAHLLVTFTPRQKPGTNITLNSFRQTQSVLYPARDDSQL